MRKNSGNILAAFVGVLLLAVIFLPMVIQLLQSDSNQAVNQRKSTVAYQLAEAAVAKGVAKLTETRKNWTDAVAGVPITRFQGLDSEAFTDIPGGTYKVAFSTGNVPGTVRITGKGRDSSTKEVRVIEAEYSGIDPDAPALILNGGLGNGSPNVGVHWGSVKSYDNLWYYRGSYPHPRLYSAGLTRYDTDPALPNTNNVDTWSYQTTLGSPPSPDLGYYKQKALNSVVPSSSTTGEIRRVDGSSVVRNPPNSGFFQSALNAGFDVYFDRLMSIPEGMGTHYDYRSSTSVLYFELFSAHSSYVHFRNMFLDVEAVILTSGGYDISGSTTTYLIFGATIPESAPYQYQGTTRWLGAFAQTAVEIWNANFSGTYAQPNHCCYNIPNVQIHGYFYAPSHVTGGANVVGVVHAGNSATGGGSYSGLMVYFDPAVLNKVVWQKTLLYRYSWKETGASW